MVRRQLVYRTLPSQCVIVMAARRNASPTSLASGPSVYTNQPLAGTEPKRSWIDRLAVDRDRHDRTPKRWVRVRDAFPPTDGRL